MYVFVIYSVLFDVSFYQQSAEQSHYFMQAQHYFSAATCFFYQNQLQQAAQALAHCLKLTPRNPIAHSNLALIYYQMGKITESKNTLTTALQLNPTNYLLYYNLFSISLREDGSQTALNYLFAGISSLHTVLGKLNKDPNSFQRALELCPNNVDAFLMLMLQQVSAEKYEAAIGSIESYGRHHKNSLFLVKLENILLKLKEEYRWQLQEEFYQKLQFQQMDRQVLKYSRKHQPQNVDAQIDLRVQQFKKLYGVLNSQLGQKTKYEAKSNEKYSTQASLSYQRMGLFVPSMVTAHN